MAKKKTTVGKKKNLVEKTALLPVEKAETPSEEKREFDRRFLLSTAADYLYKAVAIYVLAPLVLAGQWETLLPLLELIRQFHKTYLKWIRSKLS